MKFLAENKSGLESVIRTMMNELDSELADVSVRFSSIVVCELEKRTNEKNNRRGKSIEDISAIVENSIHFPCEVTDIIGEGNTRKISIVHAK